MQTLYNSDSFTVVAFDLRPATADAAADSSPPLPPRGGFEIVDKATRKEIFLQGAVALSFEQGVQAIVAQGPSEAALDDYIAGFAQLAQQPVLLH